MAKFKGAVLVCQVCGNEFKVPSCRAKTATTCSHKCSVEYRAQGMRRDKVPVVCLACGVTFLRHLSQTSFAKYCSNKCRNSHAGYRAKIAARVTGDGNGMWRGGLTDKADGYIYEACPGHPYTSHSTYVLQHRLVVERHLRETNPASPCLIKLGGGLYLSPELVVHHKNGDRKDNRLENLMVLTNGDHTRLHMQLRKSNHKGDTSCPKQFALGMSAPLPCET